VALEPSCGGHWVGGGPAGLQGRGLMERWAAAWRGSSLVGQWVVAWQAYRSMALCSRGLVGLQGRGLAEPQLSGPMG
jgi:hypothetical protein